MSKKPVPLACPGHKHQGFRNEPFCKGGAEHGVFVAEVALRFPVPVAVAADSGAQHELADVVDEAGERKLVGQFSGHLRCSLNSLRRKVRKPRQQAGRVRGSGPGTSGVTILGGPYSSRLTLCQDSLTFV